RFPARRCRVLALDRSKLSWPVEGASRLSPEHGARRSPDDRMRIRARKTPAPQERTSRQRCGDCGRLRRAAARRQGGVRPAGAGFNGYDAASFLRLTFLFCLFPAAAVVATAAVVVVATAAAAVAPAGTSGGAAANPSR